MSKKQKKMLTRIIIAAVMLIALRFIPVTGLLRLALDLAVQYHHRLRYTPKGRQGHTQPPRI